MHVLEVRNAELMESITRQAAERGITDAAVVALIALVDSFTVSTRPQGIPPRTPSEHHVAVPDNEHIVFAEAPDAPPDRGRINDTRVPLP
jgi:hypothetical protein